MKFFPFDERHHLRSRELLEQGKIGEVLFSEGTYQIEVIDDQTFWPFLQISDDGRVTDSFCTCRTAESDKSCPHLGAAYLTIVKEKSDPLHVRFRRSLWNLLCQMASRRHGYEPTCIQNPSPHVYQCSSLTSKVLFTVTTQTKEGKEELEALLWHRILETEETSLKFSNLSAEELSLWRSGRPSEQLKYELSFWSDLAKWLFLKAERGEAYEIVFDRSGLPKTIELIFKNVTFSFYIARVNWPDLIPALSSVQSPLQVQEFQEVVIENITYNPQERQMHIISKRCEMSEELGRREGGEEVGDYLFFEGVGFLSKSIDPLLQQETISGRQIQDVLTKHPLILKKYLVGTQLHTDKHRAAYALQIASDGTLTIKLYLFDPQDLDHPQSAVYGPWIYLPDRGFYLLDGLLFEGKEKHIPKKEVGDFVTRHRLWLNEFETFQTHLLGIESHLHYHLDPAGALHFQGDNAFLAEGDDLIDYGDWIYIRQRGFYTKLRLKKAVMIRPGTCVPPGEISSFIRTHREELDQIEGFFSSLNIVEKSGLKVTLNQEMQIVVEPIVQFDSEYSSKDPKVYDEFVWIPEEGFNEIPPHLRLPSDYQKRVAVDKRAEPYFLNYELPQLAPYILSIDPRLERVSKLKLKLHDLGRGRKEGEWLFDFSYQTPQGQVSLFTLWEALRAKKNYLFTEAGLIFLNDPRFNWFRSIPKKRFTQDQRRLKLSTLEWLRLSAMESIEPPADARMQQTLSQIGRFETKELPKLDGLTSQLRPYQEVGLKWLFSLYSHGISCMLCDEMGLGKTHQAMALIAAIINRAPGKKVLVVCPTSVIYHWEDLLERFLPSVRTLIYYGVSRSLHGFESIDVIVTSYGTLRSERQALKGAEFELVVFDEIQTAKNRLSQTHKALREIAAKMRLGLTGTPIENRLSELKALFDLILPGFLPADSAFREFFTVPIEKHGDQHKAQMLTKLISPFILRRKKDEVLTELPERIEEKALCELSAEQRELYKETFFKSRDLILHDVEDPQETVPYLHIFSLLSTLKQICDHPALITKKIDQADYHESGKWDLFVEILDEALASGQKVVIFSQYLDMLAIIENHLKKIGVHFAGIKGSTRDRKHQMELFKNDPNCRVFVGSLQAAGTGIDLISASIVIHYDRWWNPAKEEQATARVYRMGQKRGVLVFKLITKNTIEEHIDELIEKKKALAQIVAFDDQECLKTLDRQELVALFQKISRDVL